jgi:hypothetical protein
MELRSQGKTISEIQSIFMARFQDSVSEAYKDLGAFLRGISSGPSTTPIVKYSDSVQWQFAVFWFLGTPGATLLHHSYTMQAMEGVAGQAEGNFSWFLEQVHEQRCQLGHKSVWNLNADRDVDSTLL